MKVRLLPAIFSALLLVISSLFTSVDVLAQTNLFEFPSEDEKALNAEQLERYHSFERQNTHEHIELLRIGNLLPSLQSRMLQINLPDVPEKYIAESTQVMYHSPDEYVWHGDLSAVHGHMILVNSDGKFTGVIEFGNKTYKIEPLGGDMHVLITVKMDEDYQIDDQVPLELLDDQYKSPQTRAYKTNTTNKDIQVLVLFTEDAEYAVGDRYSTAVAAISSVTTAYYNSGITSSELSVSLAGVETISFSETRNIRSDISSLINDEEADSLRRAFWGDVVILLTDANYTTSRGGAIYGIAGEIEATAQNAFAIVEVDVVTSQFTFAHELGHLQGGRHQRCTKTYSPGGCSRERGSAHGYSWKISDSQYVWTIMHQLRSQGSRIPYFSNPNVSYIGKPTGTSINNNAQKLRDTASTIASFRTGDLLRAIILAKASGACSGDPLRIGSSVSGGIGSYSYQWAASTNGITYIDAGSSTSYSTMMPPSQDLYLKLTVTSGIQQYTDFEYIENIDGSSYCGLTKVFKEKEILTQQDQFPVAFILNEAYPNPFNPSTSITYGIPESGDIRLAVYDLWGRQVSELVNGYRSAGYHSITFDASHLPSGVYLYRLQAGSFVASKKITLLK